MREEEGELKMSKEGSRTEGGGRKGEEVERGALCVIQHLAELCPSANFLSVSCPGSATNETLAPLNKLDGVGPVDNRPSTD